VTEAKSVVEDVLLFEEERLMDGAEDVSEDTTR